MYVHKQQRKACVACRLAKCLAVGMNANFFRKVTQNSRKYHSPAKVNDTRIVQYQSPKVRNHSSSLIELFLFLVVCCFLVRSLALYNVVFIGTLPI